MAFGTNQRDAEGGALDPAVVLLTVSLTISLVSSLSFCLYCLFRRNKKKKFGNTEHTHIASTEEAKLQSNGSTGSTNGGTGNHNPFSKIQNLFATTNAFQQRRNLQAQSSVESQYTYTDKPPVSLRTETVQPAATRTFSSASGQKTPLARNPSGFLQSLGNDIFQEETKPSGSEYLGKLQFAVSYDFQVMTLTVRIIKAVELPAMDLTGTSDPFVKCCLLPDRKRKLETNIRRKTCNPSWGETFLFEGLPYDKVQQRVLYMQVLDYDRFSRNDPIGEIYMPLHTIDLTNNEPRWEYLAQCKGSNKRGALLMSLQYEPLLGIIEVTIHKGSDLKPMDLNGTSDPYVKIWLIYKGKRMDKKKTCVLKNNLNPEFEAKFEFNCPMERLRDTQLEISVMDKDLVGRNDTIGKIYLGYKSQSLEKQHWKDMLNNVRTPVQQWHVLKV